MRRILLALGFWALGFAAAAAQDGPTVYDYDGSFDDAVFEVEQAIIGRGLVIEYTSRVGEMLERTGEDVGSEEKIFEAADMFLFCSAVVSRQVMEADPMNIAHCPYGIFVAEREGRVMVGFRDFPAESMQPVRELLDGIAREATGN